MPRTVNRPAAANIKTIRSRGYKVARLASQLGIHVVVQTGTSDARTISIPAETSFNREIFLKLQSLPDKAPDVPTPEDANL